MTKYKIDGPWSGELFILARPRGGDWLEDELDALRRDGIDVLASLLTNDETKELGLEQIEETSKSFGIDAYQFPIPDLGTPASMSEALAFLERVGKELEAGRKVGIHCRQGIGRSGLVAAGLLMLAGLEPETAIRKVSAARGLSVPETIEQRDWLYALAHELSVPAGNR